MNVHAHIVKNSIFKSWTLASTRGSGNNDELQGYDEFPDCVNGDAAQPNQAADRVATKTCCTAAMRSQPIPIESYRCVTLSKRAAGRSNNSYKLHRSNHSFRSLLRRACCASCSWRVAQSTRLATLHTSKDFVLNSLHN
jgi:hypothetical protein